MRIARGCAHALLGLTVGLVQPAGLDGQNDNALGAAGSVAAGVAIIGVGIFDISTAPASAQRHNERNLLPPGEAKSPRTALLWSVGATLLPSALGLATAAVGGWNDNQTTLGIGIAGMASSWIFGPSAGHWYAGESARGWATTGIRAGLFALGVLALSTMSFD